MLPSVNFDNQLISGKTLDDLAKFQKTLVDQEMKDMCLSPCEKKRRRISKYIPKRYTFNKLDLDRTEITNLTFRLRKNLEAIGKRKEFNQGDFVMKFHRDLLAEQEKIEKRELLTSHISKLAASRVRETKFKGIPNLEISLKDLKQSPKPSPKHGSSFKPRLNEILEKRERVTPKNFWGKQKKQELQINRFVEHLNYLFHRRHMGKRTMNETRGIKKLQRLILNNLALFKKRSRFFYYFIMSFGRDWIS